MTESVNWADRAIDSWLRRRSVTGRRRKKARVSPDWADRAIDSWIERRGSKPKKSSRISKRNS